MTIRERFEIGEKRTVVLKALVWLMPGCLLLLMWLDLVCGNLVAADSLAFYAMPVSFLWIGIRGLMLNGFLRGSALVTLGLGVVGLVIIFWEAVPAYWSGDFGWRDFCKGLKTLAANPFGQI